MYYRLSYEHDGETDVKEFSANRERAEVEAWELLENHNQLGKVTVERRESEYYGDYKHCLTITRNPHDLNRQVSTNDLSYLFYGGNANSRWADELHPFKQYQLDQEDFPIRRLMWICQIKKMMFNGPMRNEFNAKRDNEVKIIESKGTTYKEIFNLAEKYECQSELVND